MRNNNKWIEKIWMGMSSSRNFTGQEESSEIGGHEKGWEGEVVGGV